MRWMPMRRDGKVLRPMTPLYDPRARRGSIAVGVTPSVPAPPPFDRDDLVLGVDWPTLDWAGVYDDISRSTYSGGSESSLPSGTYENLNFLVGNVTFVSGRTYVFINCHFNADGSSCDSLVRAYGAGVWDATFIDCTFEPTWPAHTDSDTAGGHGQAADGIKGHHFTLIRCAFINCSDGVFIFNTTDPDADSGVTVQQCLFIKPVFWRPDEEGRPEGTHNDAISINSGNNTLIHGNAIDHYNDPTIGDAQFSEYSAGGFTHGLEAGNDPEQWANGDGIFVRRSVGPIDGLVIDKNKITGGSVNIRISGSSGTITNMTITDNKLGNDGIDEGAAGVNISWDGDSVDDALDLTGNTQIDGTAISTFET